jgi:hypothetical protein
MCIVTIQISMSSAQTIIYTDPAVINALQTSVNNLSVTLNTQTENSTTTQGNRIFVGGVQIINPPNKVFPTNI